MSRQLEKRTTGTMPSTVHRSLSTEQLLPLVYEELHRLATSAMANEPPGHTLQPTALVHEAYLRLMGSDPVQWNSRGHFMCAAAHAMRRILVERARRYRRLKHGAGRRRVPVEPAQLVVEGRGFDLIALDDALNRLRDIDERKSDVVALRYFAGLTIEQTAAALGLSQTVTKSEWRYARAWLHRELCSE